MGTKIGRNDPCPCGSGKKYKKCCLDRREIKPALLDFQRPAPASLGGLRALAELNEKTPAEITPAVQEFAASISPTSPCSPWWERPYAHASQRSMPRSKWTGANLSRAGKSGNAITGSRPCTMPFGKSRRLVARRDGRTGGSPNAFCLGHDATRDGVRSPSCGCEAERFQPALDAMLEADTLQTEINRTVNKGGITPLVGSVPRSQFQKLIAAQSRLAGILEKVA